MATAEAQLGTHRLVSQINASVDQRGADRPARSTALERRLLGLGRGCKIGQVMADLEDRHHYSVVRDTRRPGYTDVALVRNSAPHGALDRLRHHERPDAIVLHHRTFRPMLELAELEAYAAQLERAAAHGNEGTLGCFVETEKGEDGIVGVALYERWFDGRRLRCEQLAGRDFDSTADNAVVDSSEFLAELRDWAERRNDERESSDREAATEDAARTERSAERAAAAAELNQILSALNERA